jgi:hypothetical protein
MWERLLDGSPRSPVLGYFLVRFIVLGALRIIGIPLGLATEWMMRRDMDIGWGTPCGSIRRSFGKLCSLFSTQRHKQLWEHSLFGSAHGISCWNLTLTWQWWLRWILAVAGRRGAWWLFTWLLSDLVTRPACSGQPKPDIGCGTLVFCVDVRSDGACSSSGPWSLVMRHASYMAASGAGGVPAIAKIWRMLVFIISSSVSRYLT